MRRTTWNRMTVAAVAVITLGVGYVASSGPLDPPPGPIGPTGASLNDIYHELRVTPVNDPPSAVDPGMAADPGGVGMMFIRFGDTGKPAAAIVEEPIRVLGFSHSISAPRDAASGLPTGRRQHKPFSITKPIDKATPLLMGSLVYGEEIPMVEIQLYAAPVDVKGPPQLVSYQLHGARVVSVSPYSRGMAPGTVVQMEEVRFEYVGITVIHEPSGAEAEDSWASPVDP